MVEVLETISHGIAVIGVTVLGYGVLLSAIRMFAVEVRGLRGADVRLERSELRQSLGYYLGLGPALVDPTAGEDGVDVKQCVGR